MITIGIDSGTQSVKALVIDGEGRVLGRGSAPHAMIEDLPAGAKEQRPEDWWEALLRSARQAVADSGVAAGEIAAIGVSGQQHGFVPLDEKGVVIRPAKLWCDTATGAQVERIVAAVGGPDAYRALIGNDLAVGFTASKILWLKENERENFARLAAILLPHDYLNFRLTGSQTMEAGDASGTGLLDVRTRSWNRQVCDAIDERVLPCLPAILQADTPAGALAEEAARSLGLTPGIPVAAGGGDNMMAAIGVGNIKRGVIALSLGTSGVITACSENPVSDSHGLIACFCDSAGAWLPLVCTMNATLSTELIRKMFGLDIEMLERAAASASPGAGGVRIFPWFQGERTPPLPESAGAILGITSSNATPANFARAAMEGVAVSLRWGWGRMETLGLRGKEIRLTGGGSKSPAWRQILADAFQLPVVCTKETDSAAFGAALQARWQAGSESLLRIVEQCVSLDEATRLEPNPANAALYQNLLGHFDRAANNGSLFSRA